MYSVIIIAPEQGGAQGRPVCGLTAEVGCCKGVYSTTMWYWVGSRSTGLGCDSFAGDVTSHLHAILAFSSDEMKTFRAASWP
jgi:hypothetical protein